MQVMAKAKALRTSSRKMNVVASLIRNRKVDDALVILEHTPRKTAKLLHKVVNSAAANAENNHNLDRQNLVVNQILVSPGFMIKRGRPVSRGRFHPIRHRTCNVTVNVTEEAKSSKKEPVKVAAKKEVETKESKAK